MAIYISTGGYKNLTADIISKKFLKNKIYDIELSGTRYSKNIINNLRNLKKINFLIHNYFPPPKKSFVLNLASENHEIYKMTVDHINYAIECCDKLNSKYYSFHAGFLCDFNINELGKVLKKENCKI